MERKAEKIGHTINFKTRKHFKDRKSHYVSEDEWTIFKHTHEAIIFDLVQKIRSNVRRYRFPILFGILRSIPSITVLNLSTRYRKRGRIANCEHQEEAKTPYCGRKAD